MGGNDAGFTTIVTQCFILKSGTGCEAAIDAARAKLPEIKQLLLDDVAGIRAAGLREDAKIVQLGYPYLQTDNDYLALGLPPYAAGDAVRSLIDDGTDALASVATAANVGHPGQMTFVPGHQGGLRRPRARRHHAGRQHRPVGQPGGRRHQHLALVPPQRPRPDRLRGGAPARRRLRRHALQPGPGSGDHALPGQAGQARIRAAQGRPDPYDGHRSATAVVRRGR